MNNSPTSPMVNSCGPCLTPNQIKKLNEQKAKDIKATINHLAKNNGYERETATVIGRLLNELIHLQGPLK